MGHKGRYSPHDRRWRGIREGFHLGIAIVTALHVFLSLRESRVLGVGDNFSTRVHSTAAISVVRQVVLLLWSLHTLPRALPSSAGVVRNRFNSTWSLSWHAPCQLVSSQRSSRERDKRKGVIGTRATRP